MSFAYGAFKTERLIVEPWDKDELADPNSNLLNQVQDILDAEVTAFLPDHLMYTEKTNVSEWCQAFDKGAYISTVGTLDNALVGLLTLRHSVSDPMHLGYIFGKNSWGKGFATELVKGLIDHLRGNKYKGVVHAGVTHGNPASVRVLQKVGFEAIHPASGQATDVDYFQLSFREADCE